MQDTAQTASPAFSPLALEDRSPAWRAGAVVLGTLFLTLSSYVEVPMVPVPMTMHTFAITMIGALYGWRLGALTVVAWLIEAAVGLPVLAGGASGLVHFAGPTAGYLFSFPIVAAIAGWLAERGWNGQRPVLAFIAALSANLFCLVAGASWLALTLGVEKAVQFGVTPFVLGAVLKSVLAAAILAAMARVRRQRPAA